MSLNIKSALNNRRFGSPQRDYLWRVVLPDLTSTFGLPLTYKGISRADYFTNISSDDGTSLDYDIVMPGPDLMANRIKNVSTQFATVETDKQKLGNTYWWYGKSNDIGALSMEFLEYEGGATFAYFNAWQALVMGNPSLTGGTARGAPADNGPLAQFDIVLPNANMPPFFYKFDVNVLRLDTKKLDLYQDTYTGCFVNSIAGISSSYESSGIMSYSISLTTDGYMGRTYSVSEEPATDMAVVDNIIAQYLAADKDLSKPTDNYGVQLAQLLGSVFL